MELTEVIRRYKRLFDGYSISRKTFLLIIIILGLILYLGPSGFRWVRRRTPIMIDPNIGCVSRYLEPFMEEKSHFDATVSQSYDQDEMSFMPYVGNGKIGIPIDFESPLYIFNKRSLSLPIWFHPIVKVELPGTNSQDGVVTQFTAGKVYKFQCFNKYRKTVSVASVFYAHRVIPSLLVQKITVTNSLNEDVMLNIYQKLEKTKTTKIKTFSVAQQKNDFEYILSTDTVEFVDTSKKSKIVVVAIASPKLPEILKVDAKQSVTIIVRTIVQYSSPINQDKYDSKIKELEKLIHEDLKQSLQLPNLEERHSKIWQQLWNTGFGISYSKAQDVLNGDKINATLYYVLSNSRAYLSEYSTSSQTRQELNYLLSNGRSCYGANVPTLQAKSLWSDLNTIEKINQVVSLWLLTLDKKGCHNLISAGAEGVMQAMVLSFGALLLTELHLEFNTHPRELHRDYFFRHLRYTNITHFNISVIVGDDNKAVIYVETDDSDKEYYACDAGCLDPSVRLKQTPIQFPVKLTEPLTSILYITSDFQHIIELKHVIHVKEIAEAPAHEHHILALHRHGHQLGGLPALFWVSIVFLIVVFHLFLAKLIYNEYCGNQDKSRGRYVV
ncbi:uncharacterized protein KIAA2013 homolog [Centruroides vittatus]|uniref:uncharacterized protein KIAA2013 homolog n=1 Tax=Centruroides vittatus TaxID=120091 RepID=UPI00351034F8